MYYNNLNSHYNIGYCYFQLKEYDEAIVAFSNAIFVIDSFISFYIYIFKYINYFN